MSLVKAYRAVISPWYGNVCRFYPSCSEYGLRALEVHGVIRGVPLVAARIVRCNPFSRGGYDPVPGTSDDQAYQASKQNDTSGK